MGTNESKRKEDSLSDIIVEEKLRPAIEFCKDFSAGSDEHRFLLLQGTDFQLRKKLLTAIKLELEKKQTGYIYVQVEDFIADLIGCVASRNNLSDFRKKYEEIPTLILEDIELIAGKEATQEEVYIFLKNRYYNNKATLIIASEDLSNYRFDSRIISLLDEWEVISV